MTAPNPTPPDLQKQPEQKPPEQPPAEDAKPRFRPGHLVAYRVRDVITGQDLTGHALVLKVAGDVVDLAVIGTGHLQTAAGNLAPAKPDELPNPLPSPRPD